MYPLTMRQAPGLPGSWTGDAGARLPPAQKAGLAPEIALEKDPSSEQVDWRALLDSNQWPSASELMKTVSTTITEESQTSSNVTVSGEPGSQSTLFFPPDTEDFATRWLPRAGATSLLTVRE